MKDINFMPEEAKPVLIPKREVGSEKNISIKAIIILVVVLFVAIAGILSPKIYVKGLEVQSSLIQADIASDKYIEVKSVYKQITSMQANLDLKKDVINNISNKEVQVLDIINYVQEATPKGLYINGMECGSTSLSISGYAKDSTAIAEYMANLGRLNVFKDYSSNATFSYDKANVMLMYKLEFSKTK